MTRTHASIRASLVVAALLATACGDDDDRTDAASGAGVDARTPDPALGEICTAVAKPFLLRSRAIGGISPNDVWLVGEGGTVMHFDGTTWQAAPSIDLAPCATQCFDEDCITPRCALVALAEDDLWVSGKDELGEDHLVRYDGTRWNAAPLPTAGLRELTVWPVERGGMWLTALTGPLGVAPYAVAYRWDGAAWTPRVGEPFDQFERIEDVSGATEDAVWAVGATKVAGGVVMRWSGSAWKQPTQPSDTYVTSVAAFGPSEVWLGGGFPDDSVQRLAGETWKSTDQAGPGVRGERSRPVGLDQ